MPGHKTITKGGTITELLKSHDLRTGCTDVIQFENRSKHLARARNQKMARSSHAYVRGATRQFYEWLADEKAVAIPQGPPVWICGDCHAGNLGPVANTEGRVQVQIRDLDQTVIGNPAHDLIRLGLSLASAARGFDLPGVTSARMMEAMMAGYHVAFAPDWDGVEADMLPESVHRLIRTSNSRTWDELARERIAGKSPTIPLGRSFWPLKKSEFVGITDLVESADIAKMVTSLHNRDADAGVRVVDAAYWMKGCSSLGFLRYAVLVRTGKKRAERDYCLIDIKEAVSPVAIRDVSAKMPKTNGERVVEGARHLSPFLGRRMRFGTLDKKSVFLRELLPQDLKFEAKRFTTEEAIKTAHYLAAVVGKAHARQLDRVVRQTWQNELQKACSSTLDAPTWLWKSIVALLSRHEISYLEHCRKFALQPSTNASEKMRDAATK